MRVTVGNIKGGVAKTTTALYLAFGLSRLDDGGRVLLVDADPEQQSATKWAGRAASEWPRNITVETVASRDLAKHVRKLMADFAHVVIDTSPKNPHLLRQALMVSDVLVVPARPQPMAVSEVPTTYDVAAEVATEHDGLEVAVLLVEAHGRSSNSMGGAAREALTDAGLPVLDAQIPSRKSYGLAFGTVPEDLGDYADVLAELMATDDKEAAA